jgi:hypothetical protein
MKTVIPYPPAPSLCSFCTSVYIGKPDIMKIEVGEFERIYPCLNENTLSEYSGRGNLHIIGVSRG